MSIESPREHMGKRGPRSLSPSLVAQRGMRLLHRTGDRLLAKTRKIGGRAGRCRDPFDKSKKLASRRLYWSAIPIAAEAHQNSLRRTESARAAGRKNRILLLSEVNDCKLQSFADHLANGLKKH